MYEEVFNNSCILLVLYIHYLILGPLYKHYDANIGCAWTLCEQNL